MNKIDCVTLDNGLKVYFYLDKKRHSTLFNYITLFGGSTLDFSIDGKEYHMQEGVAHILEHYVFECNNLGNISKLLSEKDIFPNASTSLNFTNYHFNATNNVEFGIETILRTVNDVSFDENKLKKIKEPIYQEIRGRKSHPFYQLNIDLYDSLFSSIKYRNVGGDICDVEKTDISDIKTCYNAFYQPSNQIIVVAGNFDKEKILNLIKNFYKDISLEKHTIVKLDLDETINVKKDFSVIKHPNINYVEVAFKFDISKFSPKELVNLDFYLGEFADEYFGVSSPLYKKLIKNEIISGGIKFYDCILHKYLIIRVGTYTNKHNEFKEELLKSIKNLNYFDEELFNLNMKQNILNIILRSERIGDTIHPFIDNLTSFNYPYLDTVSDIKNLSFDEFCNVIKSLDFSNYTVVEMITD